MGLILDSSVLIADERGRFDMAGLLRQFSHTLPVISAVTASELLHGVERATDAARKERRQQHIAQILAAVSIEPFDLVVARVLARIWSDLEMRGQMIGAHDLQIAATGLAFGHEVATLNLREFQRVTGLTVIDATPFRRD